MPEPAAPSRSGHRVIALASLLVAVVAIPVVVALALGLLSPRGSSGAGAKSAVPTVSTTLAPATPASATPARAPSGRSLVGLGDSVPAADTCGCTGYVEQVGHLLETSTRRPWVVHNDATGGWTTADVESDLAAPATRADLAGADLVIIEVGANDFDLGRVGDPRCAPVVSSGCWTSTLAGLRTGLTAIVDGIHRVDTRPDLSIALLGYWNVTVDGAVGQVRGTAFVAGSDQLTRAANSTIEQVASGTGADYVDTYTPLKGDEGVRDPTSDLLQDGDHLSASGHTLIAGAVVAQLQAGGAVAAWTDGAP